MQDKIIKAISGSLQKRKKDIQILSLGDPDIGSLVHHRIPTSSLMLNYILGGGIPCGRLTEVFGEESNGKSSLIGDILGQAQKMGGLGVIIDAEQAFDPRRATAMGVNVEDIVYPETETGITVEDAFEVMDAVVEETKDFEGPIVIAWDSVAASPTRAELEGEIGDQAMAAKARILSKGLRRLTGKINERTALVFINQVRSKIGGMGWGKPTESAGGYAIRFHASIRLELSKIGQVKVQDKPVGIKCKAYTFKNKTFPPFKEAEYAMYFAGGIDDSDGLLDALIESELIEQSGSWYCYKKKKFMRKDFKKTITELGDEGQDLIKQALEGL